MRDFAGKTAIVTGAASGIGLALAERFAREGMKILMSDVEDAPLRAAVTRLREAGHAVTGLRADVSVSEDVRSLGLAAVETYGSIDLLCNNAGIALAGRFDPVWAVPLADWKWAIDVNLWGVIHGVHHIVPMMLAQGTPGHIVNTASIVGFTSGSAAAVYAMTKHGVVHISEALYARLREDGAPIGVTVLCPGAVETQIAHSERNRPAALGAATHQEEPSPEYRQARASGSMAPEKAADMVMQAVRDDQFYLLTTQAFDGAIASRMQAILERSNPVFPDLMDMIRADVGEQER